MNTKKTGQTSGLLQDLKDLPRSYWVLFGGTLVNRFGHFVIPFLALNGMMIVLFELPLTSWTRRLPPRWVMAAGYALAGAGLLINVVGPGLAVLTASMVVFTLGEMIALPVANSYMAELAPEDMRGRYMGVLSMAWSAATMVGPAAGVAMFRLDPGLLWLAMFALGVVAAAAILPFRGPKPVAGPELAVEGDG